MSGSSRRSRLASLNSSRETTINKQLRRIYKDQERRRNAEERRRKFMKKWGYICSCCM